MSRYGREGRIKARTRLWRRKGVKVRAATVNPTKGEKERNKINERGK
jgi:hypothetical protein